MERFLIKRPKPIKHVVDEEKEIVVIQEVDISQEPKKPTKLAPIFLPQNKRKSVEIRSPSPIRDGKKVKGRGKKKLKKNREPEKMVDVLSISDDDENTIEDYEFAKAQRLEDELIYNSWVEKYRPTVSSQLVGQKTAVDKLTNYLKKFSEDLGKVIEKRVPTIEDELSELLDIPSYLCDVVLITGGHGIGKTSLVHAVACDSNMKVFEMNCSSKRNGKIVTETLQETTQSHHLRAQPPPATAISNFFKKVSGSGSNSPASPQPQISANTLILFDDVDIVLDGPDEHDEGFWRAVKNLIQVTRVPIVMTASSLINDIISSLKSPELDIFLIEMSKPSDEDILSYLLPIMSQEMSVDAEDTNIINKTKNLITSCKGDIRRCLNEVQFRGDWKSIEEPTQDIKSVDQLLGLMELNCFEDILSNQSETNFYLDDVNSLIAKKCKVKSVQPLRYEELVKMNEELVEAVTKASVKAHNASNSTLGLEGKNVEILSLMSTTSNIAMDVVPFLHVMALNEASVVREETLKRTRGQSRRQALHYFDKINFYANEKFLHQLLHGVYEGFPEFEMASVDETVLVDHIDF